MPDSQKSTLYTVIAMTYLSDDEATTRVVLTTHDKDLAISTAISDVKSVIPGQRKTVLVDEWPMNGSPSTIYTARSAHTPDFSTGTK